MEEIYQNFTRLKFLYIDEVVYIQENFIQDNF